MGNSLQSVLTRVNTLDGTNLTADAPLTFPTDHGQVPQLQAAVNGIKEDLVQLTLVLESEMKKLAKKLVPTQEQMIRVPFTATTTDSNNGYKNVPVVFPIAFVDAKYTISTDLQLDTANIPFWPGPGQLVALGTVIMDSNGMVEVCSTAGTTGATQPTWPTASESAPIADGTDTLRWTLTPVSEYNYVGVAKFLTPSGFIEEVYAYLLAPMILHVTATHD